MMLLFPEVDRKKTKKQAHELLNNYRALARIAGRNHIPKITTTYFFEMENISRKVEQTNTTILNRKALAENELCKIMEAMNQLDSYDRELLYDKYMDRSYTTNIAIYMKHHMSESKFYREIDKALIRFAEAYENGELLIEK
ncbi:ArpU family phage packaging/lysis transcriptional regulator [Enterococcus sp. 5H]|uniref:ArpU family phage packaging/lysis transcriptional regulator n=1 Tax=Enterococcus sp. 5H TaxID=1229490 RepID=UPI0023034343|nr:ArpU family phage packaging/lysis transcriptional regulator [Enterococcus sp. 5H]MDA9469935.1 hypothetical protein [Enterococcus sp. 5H]